MNLEKLTGFSDEALLALADKLGLIVPPALERTFLIEALLEALEEDSEERRALGDASVHVEEAKYSWSESDDLDVSVEEPLHIEHRYNETMVRVLVRDTAWAFAFWDVNDEDRAAMRASDSGYSLFLRVMEASDKTSSRCVEHFDIHVGDADLQWYINLPKPDHRYRIDLCGRVGGSVRPLAKSNVVHTPRGTLSTDTSAMDVRTAELLALSGFDELNIPIADEHHPSRILSASEIEE